MFLSEVRQKSIELKTKLEKLKGELVTTTEELCAALDSALEVAEQVRVDVDDLLEAGGTNLDPFAEKVLALREKLAAIHEKIVTPVDHPPTDDSSTEQPPTEEG